MRSLLFPAAKLNTRPIVFWVIILLVLSALLVLAAALAMPGAYSWRTHSISESAAQGLMDAWIARLAFLCFGSAVLILCLVMRRIWARATYWMQLVFAVAMIGTAAFSHKPWIADIPFDRFEDFLHSFTATGMGFAFCFGVLARFLQRERKERLNRALDILALIVATAMPMLVALFPANGGLIQRVMFAVAYVWFGVEALHLRRLYAKE